MTNEIGDIPISSVQDITIEYSKEHEEMDIVDKNTNIVFIGEDSLANLSIDFTLNKQSHPEKTPLKEQKEELKRVVQRDKTENSFVVNGKRGYIAAESVDIPESAQESNIIVGSLEGKFLPWPKHFPENVPTIFVVVVGSIDAGLVMDSNLGMESSVSGNAGGELQLDSELLIWKFLNTEVSSTFTIGGGDRYNLDEYSDGAYGITKPLLTLIRALEGNISSTFKISDGLYGQSYSNEYSSTEPVLSVYISCKGSVDALLSSGGELRKLNEIGYGNDYGTDYGGLIFDYGAGIYGRDTYNE